jgi:hypothetical protein
MDRYGVPQTYLNITLHRGLYIVIIRDRYEGTHTALTRALHGGLYLVIIMYVINGPSRPLL